MGWLYTVKHKMGSIGGPANGGFAFLDFRTEFGIVSQKIYPSQQTLNVSFGLFSSEMGDAPRIKMRQVCIRLTR